MKKLLAALCLSCSLSAAQAQNNLPDFGILRTDKVEDFTPAIDSAALLASDYIMTHHSDRDNYQYEQAQKFLLRWMNSSPTYYFIFDETMADVAGNEEYMILVYMAAMTRYAIGNKVTNMRRRDDFRVIKLNTVKDVLQYCRNVGVKMSGKLAKMNKADEEDRLQKYLKL